MMEALFTQALGLSAPWEVVEIDFDPKANKIDFHVAPHTASYTCPACGRADATRHDGELRSWQHLHFFQYRAYIHAEALRVACAHCKAVSALSVPWARPGSHFTLLFEAFALSLAQVMAVNRAAALLQVNAHRLWRVYNHHVGAARAKESFAQVRKIGVDETAAKRGHDYITTVHDLEAERLLFATPGQDQTTLAAFKADFIAHGGDPAAISDIAMDMSAAYQAGAREHFPQAEVGFDRFHIVALASTALEQVRREEAKTEPLLKGSRWAWLKRPANWTSSQVDQVHHLSRLGLRTARAWRMCLTLRQIYATTASPEAAGPQIERWIAWARRSRLEPFKRLAQTLKTHFRGVIHGFSAGVHNGRVEAMNRALQEARARARGYRNVKNFICIAYLIAGKLTHLPRSPFAGQTGRQ